MYHTYKSYVGNRIFDIGAGVGNLTKYVINDCECLVAADIFDKQISFMQKRFTEYSNFEAINFNIMEQDTTFLEDYKFDTVICINVLEHLEDDRLAINRMKSLLVKGGKIIILVPAWQKLYCHLDKNVGHHRRYDSGELRKLAQKCNMKIVENKYFNFWGIFPYYLKGKFSKDTGGSFSTDLNSVNSNLYNLMSVVLEPVENVIKPFMGLSEIIILEK